MPYSYNQQRGFLPVPDQRPRGRLVGVVRGPNGELIPQYPDTPVPPPGPSGPIIYDGPREWPRPPGPRIPDDWPTPGPMPRDLPRPQGPRGRYGSVAQPQQAASATVPTYPGEPGYSPIPPDTLSRYEPLKGFPYQLAGWERQNLGLPANNMGWMGRPPGSVPIAAAPEAAQQAEQGPYNPPDTAPTPGSWTNRPDAPPGQDAPFPPYLGYKNQQEEWEKNFAANNPIFNPYLQDGYMPNPWDPPGTNTANPNFPPNTYTGGPGEPPPKTTTGGANWYDDGINKHAFMNWINDMSEKGGGRFKPNNAGLRALVEEIKTYPGWGHVKVVEGNQKWIQKVDFGKDIGVIDLIGNAASMGGGTWQWLVPGKGAPPGDTDPDMSDGLPTLQDRGYTPGLGPNVPTGQLPSFYIPPDQPFSYDPFTWTGPQLEEFQAPSLEDVRGEPGYAFRQREGIRALENAAAAQGTLRGGNTLKDIVKWGQAFGEGAYQNAYDRMRDTWAANQGVRTQNRNQALQSWQSGLGAEATRAGFDLDRAAGEAGGRSGRSAQLIGDRQGTIGNLLSLYGIGQRAAPQYTPTPQPY